MATGDPNFPTAVRGAKRLKKAIVDLMDRTDLVSEVDDDDGEEGLPGLGRDDIGDICWGDFKYYD